MPIAKQIKLKMVKTNQIKVPSKFDREKGDKVIDRVIKENKEWLKEMADR